MDNLFSKDDNNLKWETKNTKTLLKTVVFNVNEEQNVSKTGIEGKYIILDANDWVIIVPKLENHFIMVKQWRHGAKCLSIEFPGGVIEKGEDPKTAAERELEEETGYKAKKMIKIGEINPNPALFSNKLHIFVAEEMINTGIQHLDKDELINITKLTEDELFDELGTQHFAHALMGTALAYYLRYKNK